jgi:hypothetical protein
MIGSIFRNEAGWSVQQEFDPAGLRCTLQFYLQEKAAPADRTAAANLT